jgi:hypothetical protein
MQNQQQPLEAQMRADHRSAVNRLRAIADAVSSSPEEAMKIHQAVLADGLKPPDPGMSVEDEAAAYARLAGQLPQFLDKHPEVRESLKGLIDNVNKRSGAGERSPGSSGDRMQDWQLVGFLLMCIVFC